MSLSKETLRQEAIRHRNLINPTVDDEDPEKACALFFEHIMPQKGQVVSLYWPMGREFDTRPLIDTLLKDGITCALPVVMPDTRELRFARWNESIALVPGPMKSSHPEINDKTEWVEPDIIGTPLLAFDRKGHRIGYGGGYYDATIKALRGKKDVLAVGIAYARQAVIFNLPAEDHDQKLDWVVTPKKAHCFID